MGKSWRGRILAIGAGLLLAVSVAAPLAAQDADAPPLRSDQTDEPPEQVVVALPKSGDSDYRLGPGDKVRVTVYGEDDLSGAFQVDGKGYVRLPLIGQIEAAGLTALQLEAQVESALDDGYLNDARVAVEVTDYRPFYIIGQVAKPGEYPYVSNMNALNAIALAGGFTDKAVTSVVYIRHEGDTTERAAPTDKVDRVNPGDVIRVEKTTFWDVADLLSPVTPLAYFLSTI
jgi:polysaccharide export outer membrane protein